MSYAKTRFTALMPELWLFALGGLFVPVTLFLPRGIAGLLPGVFSVPKQDSEQADAVTSQVKS